LNVPLAGWHGSHARGIEGDSHQPPHPATTTNNTNSHTEPTEDQRYLLARDGEDVACEAGRRVQEQCQYVRTARLQEDATLIHSQTPRLDGLTTRFDLTIKPKTTQISDHSRR
jgi:hypothetical protein